MNTYNIQVITVVRHNLIRAMYPDTEKKKRIYFNIRAMSPYKEKHIYQQQQLRVWLRTIGYFTS